MEEGENKGLDLQIIEVCHKKQRRPLQQTPLLFPEVLKTLSGNFQLHQRRLIQSFFCIGPCQHESAFSG